jgi:DDE superfamily endonuclease
MGVTVGIGVSEKLFASRAQLHARKIATKSRNATQQCLGFIDCTQIEIARLPGLMQRATYSGLKRRTGLKWQIVTTPNGMLFHVFGPFEGRRHDMHLYADSGLDDVLGDSLLIGGIQYHLYGDSGYALRPYLTTPFEGAALTTDEGLFNKRMSKVSVSVEWAFKDFKKYFFLCRYSQEDGTFTNSCVCMVPGTLPALEFQELFGRIANLHVF